MPLGLFSSNSSKDGPKPQPLTSEKEERTSSSKRDKSGSASGLGIDIKDSKGSTFKLGKKSYTVEKKLAEGGFALVYLVCDKHSRNYALKRQLIKDDARQVEACRTESQIVKNLNGHKNIVAYIDHQLTVNKAGVYDYMLLTVYYPTNVLQLMNSRLLSNRCLSCQEILDIFCDRFEGGKCANRPTNSATTKVLSKDTYTQAYMEEEIQRYTTLSYRAPEMIDVFSGVPIDTKSDIWALGILLYKLCYFSLPFGESALAIQNGTFTFPDTPNIPDELKAIINLLLTSSAKHRPNIFQTAYLVFAAANRKCPVYNIEKGPRIELAEAVQILRLRDNGRQLCQTV
uniref:non-specific serine/threonine protein kinase n=1 Tax=Ditylenchus dipsaci TaxID=166011 RepID=A0A915DQF1_9BILA